jgi:glycogen(starch) synthase
MRIGLVSYEYPPDTAVGGIATYTQQWAKVLAQRGHSVEVFCASTTRSTTGFEEGVFVNRLLEKDRCLFKKTILFRFAERHQLNKFDFIESPEFGCDALFIKSSFPQIRLIVKLHTPSYLVNELNSNHHEITFFEKIRFILGSYRRFKIPKKYWNDLEIKNNQEKAFTLSADFITSPSQSLKLIVSQKWKIPLDRVVHLPNPFIPDSKYLAIPSSHLGSAITYVGRLEKRKGILLLCKVIPKVLKRFPNEKFRFIGKDTILHNEKMSCKEFLLKELVLFQDNLDFIEHVDLEKIPHYLMDAKFCVFPSVWENFPTVCLEAMSASRAVIGSVHGGMEDMLNNPPTGVLIDPQNEEEFGNAICFLLENEKQIISLGSQERETVLMKYNSEQICGVFEKMLEGH